MYNKHFHEENCKREKKNIDFFKIIFIFMNHNETSPRIHEILHIVETICISMIQQARSIQNVTQDDHYQLTIVFLSLFWLLVLYDIEEQVSESPSLILCFISSSTYKSNLVGYYSSIILHSQVFFFFLP